MDNYAIQLYIELEDVQPKIWRRFIVGDMITFERLHKVIQAVMGWENQHLYSFLMADGTEIQTNYDKRYGMVDPSAPIYKSPASHYLFQFLKEPGITCRYVYDFGDHWVHSLKVEQVTPIQAMQILPLCLKGERACPPEDAGGVFAYEDMLLIRQLPEDGAYQEIVDWLGEDFDPECFHLDKVNKRLVSMRSRG